MNTSILKSCKKGFIIGLVLIFIVTISVPALAAESESIHALRQIGDAFASIAEKASPAVVGIETERAISTSGRDYYMQSPFGNNLFEHFFGPQYRTPQRQYQPRQRTQTVTGTGFIISADGYILTNNHMVEDAVDGKVKISLDSSKTLEGKVVGADPGSDVAVVKVDAKNLPYLKMADSSKLRVGEWVVAIGNPFGLSHTVTAGIVSAKGRNALNLGDVDFQDFIQTDAAINPGNSGGPLLNLDAEVVGINSAILGSTGNVGIGFAIPINMAQGVADQLIENGEVVRGFLGISMEPINDDLAESLDLDGNSGTVVATVGSDTPAEKAGLKRYDVIIEINGEPIKNPGTLSSKVSSLKPGTGVELTIIRNGKRKTLDVTLGERTQKALTKLSGGSDILTGLGIKVTNLTDEMIEGLGLDEDARGVVIASVESDSEAAKKGLERGMVITEVNRKPVRNEKDFINAVESAVNSGKKTLLLYVVNGSREDMVILRLPEE